MIIIKTSGGLGNQMFQYAFYMFFKTFQSEVKLDKSSYDKSNIHNGFELDKVFKTHDIDFAEIKDFINLLDNNKCINSKIRRKIIGLKKTHYKEFNLSYNKNIQKKFKHINYNIYFDGYWQSEKYFSSIKEEIRKEFVFQELDDEKNLSILNKIKNSISISIHIRRGDYLNNKLYKNICTLEYYKRAIEIVEKNVHNPTFFIFSNDIEWCKENFNQLQKKEFINWNIGKDSFKDMQLMSLCSHNIIANSTFSWWGAWLNTNPSKIVISPTQFINSTNSLKDLIPSSWIKI
jgi:hypothetical protein